MEINTTYELVLDLLIIMDGRSIFNELNPLLALSIISLLYCTQSFNIFIYFADEEQLLLAW